MSAAADQPPLPAALVPQGHIFYTTLHDPEGVLAEDLCSTLYRDSYWNLKAAPVPVLDRPENFYVMATEPPDEYYVSHYAKGAIRKFERELDDWQYPAVLQLANDPATWDDEQMRRIWDDPLTRACWFGLRYRRLTNQHFKDAVEWFANWVRDRLEKGTLTRSAMRRVFWSMNEVFGSAELLGIKAARLYPYLVGEKEFAWEVEQPKEGGEE